MMRDIKRTTGFIIGMVVILILSPQASGGGSWKRLEKLFVQDHPRGGTWDQNRIVFPDETENPTRSSWRPTTTPRYEDTRRLCQDTCKISREYSPVCGTNGVTYQNMDQLQCDMRCGVAVDLHRVAPCSSNVPIRTTRTPIFTTSTYRPPFTTTQRNEVLEQCIRSCPSTPEYNPICGTNYITYSNAGKMRCAKFCGVDVSMLRHAPCPAYLTSTTVAPTTSSKPDAAVQECIRNCPATPEYNPVCGTDDVTYHNVGKLECAKHCGVRVIARRNGRCTAPNSQSFDEGSSSEEDYGDDNIDPRYRPSDQRQFFWK